MVIAYGLIMGFGLIAFGLYIRDKSIVLTENGKRCIKFVKTLDLNKR
jgi:hypothetical protein